MKDALHLHVVHIYNWHFGHVIGPSASSYKDVTNAQLFIYDQMDRCNALTVAWCRHSIRSKVLTVVVAGDPATGHPVPPHNPPPPHLQQQRPQHHHHHQQQQQQPPQHNGGGGGLNSNIDLGAVYQQTVENRVTK